MSVTTRRVILVALLALALVVFIGMGVSRAEAAVIADTGDTETVTPLPISVSFQATEIASRNGAHCWEFTADQRLVSAWGKVQAWPAMEAMWCTGKNYAKVTDLVYLHCFNKGGFYTYDWCKRDPGKTGYSYLGAQGDWHYHWVINGSTFSKTPSLTIRYYANGGVTGTWYWHTT